MLSKLNGDDVLFIAEDFPQWSEREKKKGWKKHNKTGAGKKKSTKPESEHPHQVFHPNISAIIHHRSILLFFPWQFTSLSKKKKNTLVFKLQQSERSQCPGSTSLFFSPRFAVLLLKRSIFFSIKLSDNEFPTLAERPRLQINKWRRRWNFL